MRKSPVSLQDMDERNLECVCEWVAAKLQENL